MKYFIDTEFIENGPDEPVRLISIGIVCEDGREFYAEDRDCPLDKANPWVKANVVPHLRGGRWAVSRFDLREDIRAFVGIGDKPEFWGYYSDYDWVVFAQIFGTMIDLPNGWPMYCNDLKQWCAALGNPELPKQDSAEHDALNDARWNRRAWAFLNGPSQSRQSDHSSRP